MKRTKTYYTDILKISTVGRDGRCGGMVIVPARAAEKQRQRGVNHTPRGGRIRKDSGGDLCVETSSLGPGLAGEN